MNEIAKQLTEELPRYEENFVGMLTGPKSFLTGLDAESGLRSSMIFYAISTVAASILYLPFLPDNTNLGLYLLKLVTFGALSVVLTTLIYAVSWRVVGGTARIRSYVNLTFYVFGIVAILWSLLTLASKGVVKVYEPDLLARYVDFMDAMFTGNFSAAFAQPELFDSKVALFAFVVFAIGELLAFSWLVATWGAYRSLNNLRRLRSAIAFVIWFVLMHPVSIIMLISNKALDLPIF